MKRIVPYLLLIAVCASVSLADYSDGFITAGEYEYGVEWFSYDPPLIVEGGGADVIDIRNYGRLEVRYTSIPINGDWYTGGIWDIHLDDYSELLYLDGMTDVLGIDENATAVLKGGSINYIDSLQNTATKHIDLYSQSGWSWLYDDEDFDGIDEIVGITGLWENDTAFTIGFINDYTFGYDPVYMNINVVPEPATLLLFGMGGLILRLRSGQVLRRRK